MNMSDIKSTTPPAEKRCTAHLFWDDKLSLGRDSLPLGSPLQISDSPLWPPAILFDAIYAATVLHHFGTQTLKDEVAASWKHAFDPGGVMTTAQVDYNAITDETAAAAERKLNRAQARKARHDEAHSGPDTFDMLMTLPYIMVPRDELHVLREAKEKAEVREQRRVHEKVDTWMKQITPA